MADIYHNFGSDLRWSPTGDLALVSGSTETTQRLLKRLLTNTQEYIWHVKYGAGLPAWVGQPINANRLQSIVQRQVLREAAVASTPSPVVAVSSTPDGYVFVSIQYADAVSRAPQTLQFTVAA